MNFAQLKFKLWNKEKWQENLYMYSKKYDVSTAHKQGTLLGSAPAPHSAHRRQKWKGTRPRDNDVRNIFVDYFHLVD